VKTIDLKFWIAAFVIFVIAMTQLQLTKKVENEVQIVARKQDRDEQILIVAIQQAVERWDALQKNNPTLSVPPLKLPLPSPTPNP
jgi:hypothetical protein